MTTPLLRARNLSKHFGSGHTEVFAVDDVSFDIGAGELVSIMGPSGSGKTTLLSMLGGLLRPTAGTVEIDGIDITAMTESGLPGIRAHKIGFIFQAFNLLDALTVEENILFPAQLTQVGSEQARDRATALIDQLGINHRRWALPKTLSGGEKQRVAIARALINAPKLILADEPTGNLDSVSGQDVLMILYDITRDQDCSVVLVTHDRKVEDVADRILWLEDGSLRDRKSEQHKWVTDPVCGMQVDLWTSTISSQWQGTRYAFCSNRCKQRFDETPNRYLKHIAGSH